MILIEEDKRIETLLKAGFSQKFIKTIEYLRGIDDVLSEVLAYPEGAYFYLPTISEYEIFNGYKVVPILDAGQGDMFYTLLQNENESKIIFSEIEQDEIYEDYGMSINLFLIKLLVAYFEYIDDEEINDKDLYEKLVEFSKMIGMNEELTQGVVGIILDPSSLKKGQYVGCDEWIEEKIKPILSLGN